ncbi:MAG TPA: GH92 family glycosyl hydrolase [Candidatus Baltobacteraceae bacterium]|jgi:predicted alpha-1,2-mannosidase|nr:GH92 family glycosyl hydrolase [Candidatus Baltobacteraceae bacterium]
MRKTFSLVFLGFAFHLSVRGAAPPSFDGIDRLGFVNILQGTDSRFELSCGNTLPLVGAPWGMTDWSIENAKGSWYFQPNGNIDGFRATRQPSPWIGDYGQFVLMPQSGELQMDAEGRMSRYDTNTSVLRPDYEKLELKRGGITAELTATERSAVFRLTYHQGHIGRLILNAYGESEINIEGRTIRGYGKSNNGGVPGNFASYFVINLDRDITKADVYIAKAPTGASSGKGDDVAAYVEFHVAQDRPVELQVGTSLISWEQASLNLQRETDGGFDAVRTRVQKNWDFNLSQIEIEASAAQERTFYSCLYRAQMFPHRLYELDTTGKAVHYSPYDGKVHEGVLYGDIGIWDAFRTTFPLITIIYPAQLNEILQGFVNASEEGGTLPEWPSPGYRDCMIGQHCAAIFADAVVKGNQGFDVAKAYASLRKSAFQPPSHGELVRRGLADYLKLGYIPDGASTYAVSASLDYAYDDWCVAQIARQMNQAEDYQTLMARAQNYRRLWDVSTGFMRAKDAQGHWVVPFDQFAWGGPYAEGGPWQSSWFVPHDTAGLADLMGGRDKLASKLDEMMGLPPVFHTGGYGSVIHEMREMAVAKFGQYDQGNQPVFDVLYLYAAIGQPWKTEYWTRRVCSELYNSSAAGFPGDEDNGSMASWFLLSSIGLYPLCPGTPAYIFTSPLFPKTTLHLPQDRTLVITAASNNANNVYVQRRKLNGADINRTWITHQELLRGGKLDMEMGPDANMRALRDADLPYSASP